MTLKVIFSGIGTNLKNAAIYATNNPSAYFLYRFRRKKNYILMASGSILSTVHRGQFPLGHDKKTVEFKLKFFHNISTQDTIGESIVHIPLKDKKEDSPFYGTFPTVMAELDKSLYTRPREFRLSMTIEAAGTLGNVFDLNSGCFWTISVLEVCKQCPDN